jgi:signal transduction histidine kinase
MQQSMSGGSGGTLSVSSLSVGDHVCGLFDSPAERERLVARYLHDGLLKGERVVCIADPDMSRPVVARMQAAGANVGAFQASGQFQVLPTREAYCPDGRFDADAMLAALDAQDAATQEAGFPSLRITGDMAWALDGGTDLDDLVEYESRLSDRVKRGRLHGICQYDAARFPATVQLGLLASHPLALINDDLYANFYYVPPEEFLGPRRDAAMLERWRRNLQAQRALEEQQRRSAQADLKGEQERALGLFKSRFIRRAGEELQRPLEPLLRKLEDLQGQSLPEAARAPAAAALEHARHLAQVAEDILGIVAADAGEVRLKPGIVDLAALAAQAAHDAAPVASEQGVDVKIVGGRALAWGDIGLLRPVTAELTRLAIQRAGRNGQVRLVCGALGSKHARMLVLHDHPFTADETRRLFIPLGGVAEAPNGMYLARNIIDLHGGRIHADETGSAGMIEVILPAPPVQQRTG